MVEAKKESHEAVLKSVAEDGSPLSVTFLPDRGMTFSSYKKGEIEAIEQSTWKDFNERFSGLGPLIGPHFHRRNPKVIPAVKDESLFPHIAVVKAKGSQEPFSHGIARYAPWTVDELKENEIRARLKGGDTWHGVPLKELEGQDFAMEYVAKLLPKGLQLELSIRSETESVIGFHTYYALSNGQGRVIAQVKNHYNDQGTVRQPIPPEWNYSDDSTLEYVLDKATDWGFHPYSDPLHGSILMETASHKLKVEYWCDNEENSWQLWHPEGAPFVCIEPMSAKDPRKPRLSVNRLKILISIL